MGETACRQASVDYTLCINTSQPWRGMKTIIAEEYWYGTILLQSLPCSSHGQATLENELQSDCTTLE